MSDVIAGYVFGDRTDTQCPFPDALPKDSYSLELMVIIVVTGKLLAWATSLGTVGSSKSRRLSASA
jgi:hypothetical protein